MNVSFCECILVIFLQFPSPVFPSEVDSSTEHHGNVQSRYENNSDYPQVGLGEGNIGDQGRSS